MKSFGECLGYMSDWFEFHHGGCDDPTCAMQECEIQGLMSYASKLLVDAVGIDVGNSNNKEIEQNALDSYELLITKYKDRWEKEYNKEWKQLLKVSHSECSECGIVVWQPEFVDGLFCDCENKKEKA